MTTRHATLLVADDLTYSLHGKVNIFGAYTGDIIIPTDPSSVAQLIFVFLVEAAPDDPCKSLELRVTLPGGDTRQTPVPIFSFLLTAGDQRRWTLKISSSFHESDIASWADRSESNPRERRNFYRRALYCLSPPAYAEAFSKSTSKLVVFPSSWQLVEQGEITTPAACL